ncbi:expressed unknown protein [Seminavis robusta]|uniref:Uncharacterized protein n=1 Tax=Seminavis robusta TaxID=568900 RepID=A0A9N8HL45_9STRA|nr:expressed unknown protein [Seminavis robusta]|eukprot:Sro797_g203840.1 n/a (80) ;mRNA; f:8601-8994
MINRIVLLSALVASAAAFAPASRPFGVSTSLSAEWKPADGKWEETDFESELKKLEKEAEERLDSKISDMMSKVETTGSN